MKKLYIGKSLETKDERCHCCEEKQKCVVIERSTIKIEYETEWQGGVFGGVKEVVTDENWTTVQVPTYICGNCAKQIAEALL